MPFNMFLSRYKTYSKPLNIHISEPLRHCKVLLNLSAFSEPFLSASDGSVNKTPRNATINCNF